MIAISEIVPESHDYDFWTNLLKKSMIAVIFDPYLKGLQSYMVIYGFGFGLQSYLVPFLTSIAIIFGPFCVQDCNHIWFKSEKLLQGKVTRLSDLYSCTMEHLIISIHHMTNQISALEFLFDFPTRPKIFHNRHFQFGQFSQFAIHHLERNFR